MTNSEKKPLQLLLISIIVWGVSFPVIKFGLQFIPPLEFLWYRFTLASLVLVPFAIIGWKTSNEYLSLKRALSLSLLGLFGTGMSLILLYFGMNLTLASRAVLIIGINPVMTRLISNIFIKKTSASQYIGSAIVGIGLLVIVFESLISNSLPISATKGNLLVFLSALAWSGYSILRKKYFESQKIKSSPVTATTLAFLTSAAVLTPIIYSSQPDFFMYPLMFDPQIILSLLFLGIVSSILGFMTFEAGKRIIGPDRASRFLFLQPVVGIPLAIWWLGEPITLPFLLGAGIITLGVFLAERNNIKN